MATENDLREARRHKAAQLAHAFPNEFRATDAHLSSRAELFRYVRDEAARAALPEETALTGDEPTHWLFGRVVAKRGPFVVVRTPLGDAQALVRPEVLFPDDAERGERARVELANTDLSDHVAISGRVIRTKTGAAALRADAFAHVGKALLPPPDKWHGLTDVEKRYRERYVDLFANPDVAAVFRARATLIQRIRGFLDARGFLEVETPLLHQVRGGATAKPFHTHHNALDLSLFLRIAPELYLKRLLVGGFERVYEIGRCFRNEGISTRHNPEFTMLEFYQAYATYDDLMDLAESMLRDVDRAITDAHPTLASARTFALDERWVRVTMRDAILDRFARGRSLKLPNSPWFSHISRDTLGDATALSEAACKVYPSLPTHEQKLLDKARTHGEKVFLLYELEVEPHLTKLYRTADGARSVPVFITEYPFEVSPLARKNDTDGRWVDRFELFVEGREIANAFSELNDPDDQAARFRAQLEQKERGDDEAMDFDADYIRALEYGMPPAAGFGLGIDRVTMLLTNQPSIRDVLLFPLLRPEDS